MNNWYNYPRLNLPKTVFVRPHIKRMPNGQTKVVKPYMRSKGR